TIALSGSHRGTPRLVRHFSARQIAVHVKCLWSRGSMPAGAGDGAGVARGSKNPSIRLCDDVDMGSGAAQGTVVAGGGGGTVVVLTKPWA
ncbi:hypothetical protein EKO27_g11319, partial [Xylaria grammica]